jgi:acetyl/propionyl-CoA carboxylase alpha subunit
VFDTVLVADRGVAALGVVRTCERLGVQAVAVHADDDARAPHVRAADDAVPLGGSGSTQTYGDGRKVLEAARRSGAQAVHPAAGVLALDPGFAQDVLDAGLVWLGPPPDALRRATGPAPERGQLLTVVLDGADVVGIRSALGDGVRVLDEAPAAALSDDDARRVVEAAAEGGAAGDGLHAVDLALHDGAVTVLGPAALAAPGHVATQAVTGVDLVAAQLRTAAGDRAKRPDRHRAGHAIVLHLRVAELFAGRLRRFRVPPDASVDAAVAEGDRLTAQSGRLLAALTVRGADRAEALTGARAAVDAVEVAGVPTNLPLLRGLLADPSFVAGAPDDALLERIRRA